MRHPPWNGSGQVENLEAVEREFFAHLPNCPARQAVITYLQRDSELRLYAYKSRN
jgi:hypothetical protein